LARYTYGPNGTYVPPGGQLIILGRASGIVLSA
jgi:hypothetical protein